MFDLKVIMASNHKTEYFIFALKQSMVNIVIMNVLLRGAKSPGYKIFNLILGIYKSIF